MMKLAFWIDPNDEIILVTTNHIGEVVRNPARFGCTPKQIASVYKKHGEVLGTEGTAREEIIRQLVLRDWIRLRRYTNKYWSITLNLLNEKNRVRISAWAHLMLNHGIYQNKENDKYMPVQIYAIEKNIVHKDLTMASLAKEKTRLKKVKLKIVE